MTDASDPPKSPTLLPPRKSVELEDPGAHDLGTATLVDTICIRVFIALTHLKYQKPPKMRMMFSRMPQRAKAPILDPIPQFL